REATQVRQPFHWPIGENLQQDLRLSGSFSHHPGPGLSQHLQEEALDLGITLPEAGSAQCSLQPASAGIVVRAQAKPRLQQGYRLARRPVVSEEKHAPKRRQVPDL